jgi:hypothetical protein
MRNTFPSAHPNIQPVSDATVFHDVENNTRAEKTHDFPGKTRAKKVFHKIDRPTNGGCKNEKRRQSCWSDVGVLRHAKRNTSRFSRRKRTIYNTRMSEYPNPDFFLSGPSRHKKNNQDGLLETFAKQARNHPTEFHFNPAVNRCGTI